MSKTGEPNTQTNSDEVVDKATEVESTEVTNTDTANEIEVEAVEVDVESTVFKAALTAEVEKVIGGRLAREKEKITAAEAKATTAESKLSTLEQSIQSITLEKEAAEKARDEVSMRALHLELAIEEKVSPEVILSLKGNTKEELRAAIKAVSGSFKSVDRIFNGKDSAKDNGGSSDMVSEAKKILAAKFNK